ncbi:beta-lactamase/transpeptidase-like protein, partial [Bisporella sp. PMI_857]
MAKFHTPGLAVAIIDGSATWAKGFGYASINSSTPVNSETLFFGGSTTKSFTAAAISRLIDQSASYSGVTWTTPISKLLKDDFVLSDAWATEHITIEDALSHRTGYPRHDYAWSNSAKETTRNLRNLPMSAEPRAKYQYCNKMFAVIGYLVSVLSGVSLPEFMRTQLWEPNNMLKTFLSLQDARASGGIIAKPYLYNNDTASYVEVPYVEVPGDEGAGMIISNVLDYAKYLRLMIDGGAFVSPSARQAILGPHMLTSTLLAEGFDVGAQYYGLGWAGATSLGEASFRHDGVLGGFSSSMWIFPRRKFGVAVFQNSVNDVADLISRRIIYDFFQTPETERTDFEGRAINASITSQKSLDTCQSQLFPQIPPVPMPAPLASFAGTYFDAGYGNLTISLNCNTSTATTGLNSPAHPTVQDGC